MSKVQRKLEKHHKGATSTSFSSDCLHNEDKSGSSHSLGGSSNEALAHHKGQQAAWLFVLGLMLVGSFVMLKIFLHSSPLVHWLKEDLYGSIFLKVDSLPKWSRDNDPPVTIIDISAFYTNNLPGATNYAPRVLLKNVLESVDAAEPAAIGFDIDFSYDDYLPNPEFIPTEAFLKECVLRNAKRHRPYIYVGCGESTSIGQSMDASWDKLGASIKKMFSVAQMPNEILVATGRTNESHWIKSLARALADSYLEYHNQVDRFKTDSYGSLKELQETAVGDPDANIVKPYFVNFHYLQSYYNPDNTEKAPSVISLNSPNGNDILLTLSKEENRKLINGRVVLIGVIEKADRKDLFSVPRFFAADSRAVPGVCIHACGVHTLINGPLYDLNSEKSWQASGCIALLSLAILVLCHWLSSRPPRLLVRLELRLLAYSCMAVLIATLILLWYCHVMYLDLPLTILFLTAEGLLMLYFGTFEYESPHLPTWFSKRFSSLRQKIRLCMELLRQTKRYKMDKFALWLFVLILLIAALNVKSQYVPSRTRQSQIGYVIDKKGKAFVQVDSTNTIVGELIFFEDRYYLLYEIDNRSISNEYILQREDWLHCDSNVPSSVQCRFFADTTNLPPPFTNTSPTKIEPPDVARARIAGPRAGKRRSGELQHTRIILPRYGQIYFTGSDILVEWDTNCFCNGDVIDISIRSSRTKNIVVQQHQIRALDGMRTFTLPARELGGKLESCEVNITPLNKTYRDPTTVPIILSARKDNVKAVSRNLN